MDLISVLNTAFIICLSGTILFFIISIVLFFLFDIKTIYMIRSGRAQAKTVKEMQAANAGTGRLRVGRITQTSQLKKRKSGKTRQDTAPPISVSSQTENTSFNNEVSDFMDNDLSSDITEQLGVETSYADTQESAGNDLSGSYYPESVTETSVLSQMDSAEYEKAADYSAKSEVYFDIVKKIILRDTDEIIR